MEAGKSKMKVLAKSVPGERPLTGLQPSSHLLTVSSHDGEQAVLVFFFQFSSVQSLSCVWLFATPWTAAHLASLPITNPWSLLKLMSVESVMSSNHLILCHPLLLLPSIFSSIGVFSKESVSSSHQVAKVLEFQLQHQSFQWIFRTDFL